MSSSEKSRDRNPLKKIAEGAVEKPGMYLIALRAHVNRGRSMIRNVFESVADALPGSAKAGSTDRF